MCYALFMVQGGPQGSITTSLGGKYMEPELKIPLIVVSAAIVVLISIGYIVEKVSCNSRWENSGYSVNWGPMSGCRLVVDGKLVPEAVIFHSGGHPQ